MRETILQTRRLSKSYGSFKALDNVDMTVYKGDIYGLIGRNGAGKTTIMKIVTGLAEKSGGEFELFSKRGEELGDEKCRIGCLIENPAFFGGLTARQNLNYYAIQKGITDKRQIDRALELVNLTDVGNKKFRKFSLGMKQRLGIAFALMDNPDFIILDEPINGLDPIGIRELRDTFQRLNAEEEITFLISSHILSELYMTANRFLIIDKGRVLKELTKEELDLACMRCLAVQAGDVKQAAVILEQNGISNYKVIDGQELRVYDDSMKPERLNRLLVERGVDVSAVFEAGISLEDYYTSLVNGKSE